DFHVTGVQTCALPICGPRRRQRRPPARQPPRRLRPLPPHPHRQAGPGGPAQAQARTRAASRHDQRPARPSHSVTEGRGEAPYLQVERTIGGNTSGSLSGRYFNGDGVYAKSVSRSSDRIYGYGRPNYASEDDMRLSDTVKVKDWVRKRWPKDKGLADGAITVNTALGSGYAYSRIAADTSGQVLTLLKSVADRVGAPVEVDAVAVAQAVLAQLTPERIAAAIPAEIAEQVVSALGARLAPEEGP